VQIKRSSRPRFTKTPFAHGAGTAILASALFAMALRCRAQDLVDIADSDAIFHTIWDIDARRQIPGAQFLRSGQTYEQDGIEPRWRAIYDDEGRIMVAICHNMDLGDAVEHADTPRYPEEYSAQAMRIFGNYVVYAFTH
jgi:hypothetical protein